MGLWSHPPISYMRCRGLGLFRILATAHPARVGRGGTRRLGTFRTAVLLPKLSRDHLPEPMRALTGWPRRRTQERAARIDKAKARTKTSSFPALCLRVSIAAPSGTPSPSALMLTVPIRSIGPPTHDQHTRVLPDLPEMTLALLAHRRRRAARPRGDVGSPSSEGERGPGW